LAYHTNIPTACRATNSSEGKPRHGSVGAMNFETEDI
jgi:hypothetical protein